jgi:cell wall-associated NlpC family hydrolase
VRRLVPLALALAFAAAPASAASTSRYAWATKAIRTVTSHGLFPGTPATFRPGDPLTASELQTLLTRLGAAAALTPPASDAPVSISQLDAAMVDALGLHGEARALAASARAAGLDPPRRFGTEAVARLLGLRVDLPVRDDALEPQPDQPASRAEAAFTAARILALGLPAPPDSTPLAAAAAGGGVAYVSSIVPSFALPALTRFQQELLRTAVSLIGYPYVWGGDDETAGPGFDCSGLVWRVFKLASYADMPGLGDTIQGRSAAQMAAEVPRSERIGLADLQPADVLFFGPKGRRTRAVAVDHAAIYLGNGWLIESSGQGVSLGRLDWLTARFAWARRPLAEAGLESPPAVPVRAA